MKEEEQENLHGAKQRKYKNRKCKQTFEKISSLVEFIRSFYKVPSPLRITKQLFPPNFRIFFTIWGLIVS